MFFNPLVSIQPFLPQGDGTYPCRPKVQLLQKKEKNRIQNIVTNYALTARTKVNDIIKMKKLKVVKDFNPLSPK